MLGTLLVHIPEAVDEVGACCLVVDARAHLGARERFAVPCARDVSAAVRLSGALVALQGAGACRGDLAISPILAQGADKRALRDARPLGHRPRARGSVLAIHHRQGRAVCLADAVHAVPCARSVRLGTASPSIELLGAGTFADIVAVVELEVAVWREDCLAQ